MESIKWLTLLSNEISAVWQQSIITQKQAAAEIGVSERHASQTNSR